MKIVTLHVNTLLISTDKALNLFCILSRFILQCNNTRFYILLEALGTSDQIPQHTFYYLFFFFYILNMHISSSSTFWTLKSLSIVKQSANKRIQIKTIQRKTSQTILTLHLFHDKRNVFSVLKKNVWCY